MLSKKIIALVSSLAGAGVIVTVGAVEMSNGTVKPVDDTSIESVYETENTGTYETATLGTESGGTTETSVSSSDINPVDSGLDAINKAVDAGISRVNDAADKGVSRVDQAAVKTEITTTKSSETSQKMLTVSIKGTIIFTINDQGKAVKGEACGVHVPAGKIDAENKCVRLTYTCAYPQKGLLTADQLKDLGVVVKDDSGNTYEMTGDVQDEIEIHYTDLPSTLYFCFADQQITITIK